MIHYISKLSGIRDLIIQDDFLYGKGEGSISFVSDGIYLSITPESYIPFDLDYVGVNGTCLFLKDKNHNVLKYDFVNKSYGDIITRGINIRYFISESEYVYLEPADIKNNYFYYSKGGIKYEISRITNPKFYPKEGIILHVVSLERQVLQCYSFGTGKELWHYDAKDRAKYYDHVVGRSIDGKVKNYQFYQNSLIIYSGMGHFARVDLKTGAILWEVKYEGFTAYGIDQEGGKLHGKWGFHAYRIIDLETGAVELEMPFRDKLRSQNVDTVLTYFCISGNNLYACTKKGELVVLDKYTLDLLERHTLPGNDDGIPDVNAPIKMGKRIYVHDGNQQLHIFEEGAIST